MSNTMYGVVGAIVVVQVILQVTALIQLVRTPAERVTLGGRKWLWAIIILLTEIIGPIAWFAAGRSAAQVDTVASVNRSERTSAVDSLYGKKG